MSRPSPQSEPTAPARKLREGCALMLDQAANAGLLAPIHLLIAELITGLLLRLANLFDLWRAGALPAPAAPRARPRPSRRTRPSHHARRPRTHRRARRVSVVLRPRHAVARANAPAHPAPPPARPVERYPKL